MQYPAIVIANEIIKLANTQQIPVSPMKLQKILYLANGIAFKRLGDKLINEHFEAWDYGPVIRNVYDSFKNFRGDDINKINNDPVNNHGYTFVSPSAITVDSNSLNVIREAWDSAKNLTAFTLSAWSHNKNSPWDKAFHADPKELYISDEDIKSYFNGFITD